MTTTTKHLVVVGGGVGGIAVAKALAKSTALRVTMVAPYDYAEWPAGAFRSLVVPSETSQSIVPSLAACVKHAKVVKAMVTQVKQGAVTLSTGETIEYDFLVIATGGRYAHASASFFKSYDNADTLAARVSQVQAKAQELAGANSVTIVGGGVSGIELTCEIAHTFPDKKVTLASKSEIGGQLHPKVQKQADIVYHVAGFKPTTEFLQGGLLASALDNSGLLKVDRSTLLVQGTKNVFAIGDMITPGLMEAPFASGYVVQGEAPKLAKNIILAASGQPLKPMGKAAMKRGGLLSLGKGYGAGHFDNMVLPQCMVAMMKSKDVFRKKMTTGFMK